MFYPNKHHHFNFALMKKITLFVAAILIAVISFGQTVPVRAKTFQITYGSDSYSINLNGDSILIDASDFIRFADKVGLDTLLFGDGTFLTSDTGLVKTTGDSLFGTFSFGNGSYFDDSEYYLQDGAETATYSIYGAELNNGAGINLTMSPKYIHIQGNSRDCYVGINDLYILANDTALADDGLIEYTNVVSGWGEVYAFNSGAIDEWAEFIISGDGSVYLKSNSTDVVNTDTDNKLCIFDNGSGFTIKNRLGGNRAIKYIIHR